MSGLGQEGRRLLWGRVRTQPGPGTTGTRGKEAMRDLRPPAVCGKPGCAFSPLTVQFRSIEQHTVAFLDVGL